ncbi:extracellular solute-binding protein [Candidatus Gracilibacteria bacterium]|nr:extracellular solute-binding protein [Candidatus Gracilibacteria bacterium]
MKTKILVLLSTIFLFWGCEEKTAPVFSAFEGKTLSIWAVGETDFLEALGKEFVSTLGTQNTKVQVLSFRNQQELETTLLNQMALGKGPDVLYTNDDWVTHNKEKIVSLVGDSGLSIEKFKIFFISASQGLINGDFILGVPLGVETLGMFYNREYLEERLDLETPPSTWEAFRDNVKMLTKQDNSLTRFSLSGAAIGRTDNIQYGGEIAENLLFQLTGNLFDQSGEAIFATNTGVTAEGKPINFGLDALNFFLSFATPNHQNFSWNELLAEANSEGKDFTAFITGKTSFVFGTSQDFNKLLDLQKETQSKGEKTISEHNIAIAAFPQFSEKSSERHILASLKVLTVPHSTQDPDFAWSFLKFAIRKENLRGFSDTTRLVSADKELLLEQEADATLNVWAHQAQWATTRNYPISMKDVLGELASLINNIHQGKIVTSTGLTRLQEQFRTQWHRIQALRQALAL